MDEIQFIYQITEYESEKMMPHISKALEKRLKLRQQQMMPGRVIPEELTEEQKKKMKRQRLIRGLIWLILGIVLLVVYSQQEEGSRLLMFIGIIAIVAGVSGLLKLIPQKQVPQEKYDAAAREFLQANLEGIRDKKLQICFSDEEMVIVTGELEDLDQEPVEYGSIEMVAEGEDFFFMTYDGRGSILMKKDLTLGSVDEFRQFIMLHVPNVISLTEQKPVPTEEKPVEEELGEEFGEEVEEEVEEETEEEE